MIRHRCLASLALCLCILPGSIVFAQSAGIPKSAKETGNVQGSMDAIKQTLAAHLERLQSDDTDEQRAARAAIVDEISVNGNPAHPSFLSVYCAEFANEVMPLLESEAMPVRLNAAIVTARLADRSRSGQLIAPTLRLLADAEDPVALWGLKAARALMSTVVANPGMNQGNLLVPAVLKLVETHPAAYLAQDAYEALMLGYLEDPKPVQPAMLASVAPAMLKAIRARLLAYQNGIPDEPMTENRATLFLTDAKVWDAQPAAMQLQIAQDLLSLLSFATQRIASTSPGSERSAVVKTAQPTGKAIGVIGRNIKDKAIETAANQAAQIIEATSMEETKLRISNLYTALKANARFAEIKKPPVLPSIAAGASSGAATSTSPAE